MYQRSPAEDPERAPSPLRGLLIAAPVAIGIWVLVAELVRFVV